MVFTVGEEVNQPDQGSVLKGKQRRHVSSGRKSKGALSTLASSKTKDSSPHRSGAKNNHSKPVSNEIGNTSSQNTENGPQNNTPTVHQKAIVSSSTDLPEQPDDTAQAEQLKSNGGEQITTSISTEDIPMDCQDLGASSIQGADDRSENAKLKQLLMLQVSLISRQQDLLRLRDREIMQLKASNANYKCQLSRVRRRMSKRKSDADESPKSVKRKVSESQLDAGNQDVDGAASNSASTPFPDTTVTPHQIDRQKSKKRRLEYPDGNTEESYEMVNESASKTTREVLKEDYETPGTSGAVFTPQSTKYPVPVEFIDQKQAELMHAMMISPPDKAVKTFCDITKSSSPPLDEFPFKICDRCPHCVAIAQEIIRLFKTAENIKSPKKIDKEIFNIAGVLLSSDLDESGSEGRKFPIMRTSYSYHRIPPSFDQNHWWWDLKCGDIKSDSALKIPTWKEHVFAPLPVDSSDDIVEAVDDQTFTKRHSKLEYDEKRRKRWDIQRIREYRYNEKLRQKIHKQGAVYDSPIIESFSGHLHDAISVEVNESLPVNVFGYPAPQMETEEFSLTPMRESINKSVPQSVGSRRRGRKA